MKELENKWVIYEYERLYAIRCILCVYDSFVIVRTIRYEFKDNNVFWETINIKELVSINEILGRGIYDSKEEALKKLKENITSRLEYERQALERRKQIEKEQEEERQRKQRQRWWIINMWGG